MSYYEAPYYRNPVPYTHSDIGEPVPGWGTTVSVAGPARVGIGAFGEKISRFKAPKALSDRLILLEQIRDSQIKVTCPSGSGVFPSGNKCPSEKVISSIARIKAEIAALEAADESSLVASSEEESALAPSQVGGLPWWVWPLAAAGVLGGVGYYGTRKGWF